MQFGTIFFSLFFSCIIYLFSSFQRQQVTINSEQTCSLNNEVVCKDKILIFQYQRSTVIFPQFSDGKRLEKHCADHNLSVKRRQSRMIRVQTDGKTVSSLEEGHFKFKPIKILKK